MVSLILFILAVIFTLGHITYHKIWEPRRAVEVLLSYILFFNMGIMSLLAAYLHIFMGPETAQMIGWQPGSPFQFEMGMANLSYGILGILAYWIRGRFWDAAIIGWSILLLGCFVGHVIDYYINHNSSPWNIGLLIWINDLILPLVLLSLLVYLRQKDIKE